MNEWMNLTQWSYFNSLHVEILLVFLALVSGATQPRTIFNLLTQEGIGSSLDVCSHCSGVQIFFRCISVLFDHFLCYVQIIHRPAERMHCLLRIHRILCLWCSSAEPLEPHTPPPSSGWFSWADNLCLTITRLDSWLRWMNWIVLGEMICRHQLVWQLSENWCLHSLLLFSQLCQPVIFNHLLPLLTLQCPRLELCGVKQHNIT